jgi:hypothetical protein
MTDIATAANAATASFAVQMKEKIANMPDTFNTKKEIEAYVKEVMKNIKTDDKPKKGLTAYQQFISDNSKSVKEQNPTFTGKEVFSRIATMWNESKNKDKSKPIKEDESVVEEEPNVEVDEIKEVPQEVPDVKPKAKADSKKKK